MLTQVVRQLVKYKLVIRQLVKYKLVVRQLVKYRLVIKQLVVKQLVIGQLGHKLVMSISMEKVGLGMVRHIMVRHIVVIQRELAIIMDNMVVKRLVMVMAIGIMDDCSFLMK